jgi:hypothetical protein
MEDGHVLAPSTGPLRGRALRAGSNPPRRTWPVCELTGAEVDGEDDDAAVSVDARCAVSAHG